MMSDFDLFVHGMGRTLADYRIGASDILLFLIAGFFIYRKIKSMKEASEGGGTISFPAPLYTQARFNQYLLSLLPLDEVQAVELYKAFVHSRINSLLILWSQEAEKVLGEYRGTSGFIGLKRHTVDLFLNAVDQSKSQFMQMTEIRPGEDLILLAYPQPMPEGVNEETFFPYRIIGMPYPISARDWIVECHAIPQMDWDKEYYFKVTMANGRSLRLQTVQKMRTNFSNYLHLKLMTGYE